MSDERPPIERVLELAVYAPVGAALTLCEHLPKRVRQRRQALENRLQLARFIGKLAVQTGQRELAKRIDEQRAAKQAADTAVATVDAGASVTRPVKGSVNDDKGAKDSKDAKDSKARLRLVADGADGADGAVSAADQLPIRDYESLAAIHVVERLRSMRPDEIELIRQFEVAHRSRRTILAKIDQLQGR